MLSSVDLLFSNKASHGVSLLAFLRVDKTGLFRSVRQGKGGAGILARASSRSPLAIPLTLGRGLREKGL